jgi:hypothetical protein
MLALYRWHVRLNLPSTMTVGIPTEDVEGTFSSFLACMDVDAEVVEAAKSSQFLVAAGLGTVALAREHVMECSGEDAEGLTKQFLSALRAAWEEAKRQPVTAEPAAPRSSKVAAAESPHPPAPAQPVPAPSSGSSSKAGTGVAAKPEPAPLPRTVFDIHLQAGIRDGSVGSSDPFTVFQVIQKGGNARDVQQKAATMWGAGMAECVIRCSVQCPM